MKRQPSLPFTYLRREAKHAETSAFSMPAAGEGGAANGDIS